jgi:lysophospholipase L1-like esterase
MICAFAILFASCSGGREAATGNERIIFLGDSITASGDEPGGYVSLARDSLTRSSNGQIQVIGAGISGNRVPDLLARVDHDVIELKPTLTIIYIGINDVWHWAMFNRGTPKSEYEAGLKELIRKIQAAGSRVILCTPSVIGEKRAGTNPSDSLLEEYAGISRSVAETMHVQLLDLHAAFAAYLATHNPQDAEHGILTVDGVHLTAEGNRFVAEQMLAAIGANRIAAPATEKQ